VSLSMNFFLAPTEGKDHDLGVEVVALKAVEGNTHLTLDHWQAHTLG